MFNIIQRRIAMKKVISFIGIFSIFMLAVSCKHEYGSIINDSSYTVSGETARGRKFTLSPGASEVITDYYESIETFSAVPPRVSLKKEGDNLVFYNTSAINFYVYNTTDKSVELYSQNCIGDGSEPVNIAGNYAGNPVLNIYNLQPVFTAFFVISGIKYPATVIYTYDWLNNLMTATIQ
jgi:hypothetical protein